VSDRIGPNDIVHTSGKCFGAVTSSTPRREPVVRGKCVDYMAGRLPVFLPGLPEQYRRVR